MNRYSNLNYLYCMNIQCQGSIYHRMVLRVPSDNQDYVVRRCSFCDEPMVSERAIGIKYMITKVNSQWVKRPGHFYN
jgi:hypothetical protein